MLLRQRIWPYVDSYSHKLLVIRQQKELGPEHWSHSLLQQFGNASLSGQDSGFPPTAGGQGGAAAADFDTLIDLIKATVALTVGMIWGEQGQLRRFPVVFM